MQAAQQAETPSSVGRYALRRRIAVGGMAEVFEAHDTENDERVVVKLLLPQLCSDAEVLQMFADEARLTTQLTHDNLVRTHDTGELRGRPYLVMELVDGCTLDALLKRSGTLAPDLAGRIALDVLRALHYLHDYCDAEGQWLHIVHRDVNPRNVLVSRDGAVKLADFGIARSRVRAARTRSGVIKGTVQYMSPEQITGSDLDHRADLYGVGLLLFEMLTGRPYIEGEQEIDLLRVAENPCWRAPSKVAPTLEEGFDELLQPALMQFPEQRYRDARAFEEALNRALEAADLRAASPTRLGELVSSLPARSGTVPPLVPTLAPERPTTARRELPAEADAVGPMSTRQPARRWKLWLGAAALVGFATAGVLVWQLRTSTRAMPDRPGPAGTLRAGAGSEAPRPQTTPALARPTSTVARVKPIATATPTTVALTPVALTPVASSITTEQRQPSGRDRRAGGKRAATRRHIEPPAGDRRSPRRATRTPRLKATQVAAATSTGKAADAAPVRDERLALLRRRLLATQHVLRSKGIGPADLSGELRQNLRETLQALEQGDVDRATDPLTALERSAASASIDRAFVQRKLSRVDRALRQLPAQRQDVQRLRQRSTQALQAFMDGDFALANRQLNRILTLLKKNP